jgi:hypothetical protein
LWRAMAVTAFVCAIVNGIAGFVASQGTPPHGGRWAWQGVWAFILPAAIFAVWGAAYGFTIGALWLTFAGLCSFLSGRHDRYTIKNDRDIHSP